MHVIYERTYIHENWLVMEDGGRSLPVVCRPWFHFMVARGSTNQSNYYYHSYQLARTHAGGNGASGGRGSQGRWWRGGGEDGAVAAVSRERGSTRHATTRVNAMPVLLLVFVLACPTVGVCAGFSPFFGWLRCIVCIHGINTPYMYVHTHPRPLHPSIWHTRAHGVLDRALVAGDVFLGGLLVSSLTKLTVRALEAQGALSAPAKEMQVWKAGV